MITALPRCAIASAHRYFDRLFLVVDLRTAGGPLQHRRLFGDQLLRGLGLVAGFDLLVLSRSLQVFDLVLQLCGFGLTCLLRSSLALGTSNSLPTGKSSAEVLLMVRLTEIYISLDILLNAGINESPDESRKITKLVIAPT